MKREQHFTFSPYEDGQPIVCDGKAVAYVEEDSPPLTGYILASAQDVREKLEELALYLQSSLRLKGCKKAECLADEALQLLLDTTDAPAEYREREITKANGAAS